MNYRVVHTTTYSYDDFVRVCHNLVLLTPRGDTYARCRSHRLNIRPTPQYSAKRTDFFGNLVHSFTIEENHRQLTVSATSRVQVDPPKLPAPKSTEPWEIIPDAVIKQTDANWFGACPFQFDSARITRSEMFADYARESFTAKRPVFDAALDLTQRIHRDFKYDAKSTDVTTAAEKAFAMRKGVCQDFAHVQVACLRSIGIPARYVSGYLRTIPPPGKPRIAGADQSHAWCSVYCGSAGWIDLDPTNAVPCSRDHVPVAWGRDFDDVVPIRGVFLGGGAHRLTVSVDVEPLGPGPTPHAERPLNGDAE